MNKVIKKVGFETERKKKQEQRQNQNTRAHGGSAIRHIFHYIYTQNYRLFEDIFKHRRISLSILCPRSGSYTPRWKHRFLCDLFFSLKNLDYTKFLFVHTIHFWFGLLLICSMHAQIICTYQYPNASSFESTFFWFTVLHRSDW